jgi:hypothetical protein
MPYFDREEKKWRGVVTIDGKRHQRLFLRKSEASKWEAEVKHKLAIQTDTVSLLEVRTSTSITSSLVYTGIPTRRRYESCGPLCGPTRTYCFWR